MVTGWARPRAIVMALALVGTGVTSVSTAASAQEEEGRLRKIESEVRALQRKVFPGGDGRFFAPEVQTGQTTGATGSNLPSTTAVTDILGRLDAMEGQLSRLTGQTEVNTNAIALLTARLDGAGIGITPAATAVPATAAIGVIPVPAAPAVTQPVVEQIVEQAGPTPERLASVQEIAKPQTDDAGDDEYSYGYRLWNAGFFPEAQQQLRLFSEKYPSHWRLSYGRNLLGRAFLDDSKPREAAPWFLQNYQSDKQGVRAGDSLLYLAQTMIAIEDTNRACIALSEFGETYPALASGRLLKQYEANRAKVTCN